MKVSVVLLTYNHERFIHQALQSVLEQQTDFAYEIIIVEDCSTDRTRDMVIDFHRQYPDRIRLHLTQTNVGDNRAWGSAIQEAQGSYVALLDGDDYWTSPHKLQKQADFLDDHPDFALCFHNVTSFFEDGSRASYLFNEADQLHVSTLKDLWEYNFIAGCSPMLRKACVVPLPEWFNHFKWGDWPLYMLCAQHGNIGYINEVMGAYRIHSGGMWSRLSETQQIEAVIAFYQEMSGHLDQQYARTAPALIAQHYFKLAQAYERNDERAAARAYLLKSLQQCLVNPYVPVGAQLRMVLKLYLPAVYGSLRTIRKSIR